MFSPEKTLEMAERYKRLYTALIFDYLDEKGLPNQALASEIKPLTHDMKLAGPAFTIRGHSTPIRNEEIHNLRLSMMKDMTMGCIQIRDVGKDERAGHFGEITAVASYAAGCRGAVIDGGTRDSNYLINMGFPTFSRFQNPVEAAGRWMAFEYQVDVYVRGVLGDVIVHPGDWLLGDRDGVVVIPSEMVVETLEACEDLFEQEAESRQAMAAGEDPMEVYKRLGRF